MRSFQYTLNNWRTAALLISLLAPHSVSTLNLCHLADLGSWKRFSNVTLSWGKTSMSSILPYFHVTTNKYGVLFQRVQIFRMLLCTYATDALYVYINNSYFICRFCCSRFVNVFSQRQQRWN
jgi:hypothetical protein